VPPTEPPPTLPGLVATRLLDPAVAALTWLLVERGVPILVAASDGTVGAELLDALVAALPEDRRPDATAPAAGGRLVRVAGTLTAATPPGLMRAALAVTTGRSGLAAVVEAADLAGVLDVLARQGLTDDERSFLGIVLVIDRPGESSGGEPRVVAAHYLRPVMRDAGGHPRRERPAVLATWDPRGDRWEDFAWGITPDLAERCRLRAGDFDAERERRATLLANLAARGAADPGSFAAAARRLALDSPVAGD
jgi:hypothetical protein